MNHHQLSLIRLIESIYAKQLLPGVYMNNMGEIFVAALQAALAQTLTLEQYHF